MKKILSLFMFVLCFAMSTNAQTGGTAGNLVWNIESGVLTISGEGEMNNYKATTAAPWSGKGYTSVVVEEGVTSIGNYAFYNNKNLVSVEIPSTVEKVGAQAFGGCTGLVSIFKFGAGSCTVARTAFNGISNKSNITLYYELGASGWADLSNAVFYKKADALMWVLNANELTIYSNSVYNKGNFDGIEDMQEVLYDVVTISLNEGVDALKVENGLLLSADGTKLLLAPNAETKVIIPSNVSYIGDYALYGCYDVETVEAQAVEAPELGNSVFSEDIAFMTTLYLPNSTSSNYAAWLDVYEFLEVIEGELPTSGSLTIVNNAGEGSWEYDAATSTLTLRGNGMMENLEKMPWSTFKIETVVVDGLYRISDGAFAFLNAKNFVIGADVMEIGYEAFYGNDGAMFTFANNAYIEDAGISGDSKKILVIEETNRGSYWAADALMTENTNTYDKVTVKRTFNAGASGTIILPFNYTNNNIGGGKELRFYEVDRATDESIIFEEVSELEANKPYLWINQGKVSISELNSQEGLKVTLDAEGMGGELKTTTTDGDWTMIGTYVETKVVPEKPGADSDIWLYTKGVFKSYANGVIVDPYRAYFKGRAYSDIFKADNINGERSFSVKLVNKDGETTSIDNVTIDNDGAINFGGDNTYYDLSGRRVVNPVNGIYIVNGKKVIIK